MTQDEYNIAINDLDRVRFVDHPLLTVEIKERAHKLKCIIEKRQQDAINEGLAPQVQSCITRLEELEAQFLKG